ncbi:hypothetical protein [Nitrosomonas communis]|uniref:Uncharacterized protein n=1 Tax=Nitrosomonas communis TaxID=44574 RepID=A0A1I4UR90_9PROT|nr:hypothetical protein [Nitrosomonas communis]SFM91476.1 hypothetical protein SAMN05421863_10692 [Nitrosomonas communis]
MLQSIDILIGVVVVMLVASLAVTMLTQSIIAAFGSKGRNLLQGLAGLITHLSPGFSKKHAEEIIKMVLKDDTVNGGRKFFGLFVRYGNVIHREELTKMLLELAAKVNDPSQLKNEVQKDALNALKKIMAANGITNPEQTLGNVRMFALQLEKSYPEMASNVRHNLALMEHANSQFLAKINSKFDLIIDRVSERFTFNARIMTFFCAALVAVTVQLDTITLVNRFAMDEATRAAIVNAAITTQSAGSKENQSEETEAIAKRAEETANMLYRTLSSEGILSVPKINIVEFFESDGNASFKGVFHAWIKNWQNVNLLGIVISIFLLTLGAPFWYSVLGKLLLLRSLLARKDDEQRTVRQTSQQTSIVTARSESTQLTTSPSVLTTMAVGSTPADERNDEVEGSR